MGREVGRGEHHDLSDESIDPRPRNVLWMIELHGGDEDKNDLYLTSLPRSLFDIIICVLGIRVAGTSS